jgi:hypothetical protein
MKTRVASVLSGLLLAAAHRAEADSPDALARRIQEALRTGNADALVANAPGLDRALAVQQFALYDLLNDCGPGIVCAAAARPLDPAWEAQQREVMAPAGVELSARPAGLIEIVGRAAKETDATKISMKASLPYASVGGRLGIVSARLTPARLAELSALTPQAAAQATLAAGVFDSMTGETDPQWVKKAKALPADGGEPGRAFLAGVQASAAAVKARDVAAAAAARGDWGKQVLGPTDFAGRTRTPAEQQNRLRAQALRFVVEARVLGGYELGDLAVLTVEGKNGAGARVLGALKMRRENGAWQEVDSTSLVEVPSGR